MAQYTTLKDFLAAHQDSLPQNNEDLSSVLLDLAEASKIVSKDVFASLIDAGIVDDDTIVFNNLVSTKSEFEEKWKIPLAQSWHKQLI